MAPFIRGLLKDPEIHSRLNKSYNTFVDKLKRVGLMLDLMLEYPSEPKPGRELESTHHRFIGLWSMVISWKHSAHINGS